MHVGDDWGGGLGGVEGLCEEGAEDSELVGVFGAHGVFEVFSGRLLEVDQNFGEDESNQD